MQSKKFLPVAVPGGAGVQCGIAEADISVATVVRL